MDTLRDLEMMNGTHGRDAEAAFAKVSKDVEQLRYACQKSPVRGPCDTEKRLADRCLLQSGTARGDERRVRAGGDGGGATGA